MNARLANLSRKWALQPSTPGARPFVDFCRFNTLAWGSLSSKQYGLIAGGKENGELDLYDPAAILAGVKEPIARHALFSGPVKGLDFSTVNHSLLGAGGPDGEVF